MMARKLAGLFTILSLGAYFATWLALHLLGDDSAARGMRAEQAWQTGIGVAVLYFMVGLFMATLAIGLMQEMLAERRSRETERRFRARQSYEALMEGEASERPAAPESAQ